MDERLISVLSEESRKVSELPRVSRLLSSDVFAAESSREHSGFSFTYSGLIEDLAAMFRVRTALGSMAYKETWEYSEIGHVHDYTKTIVTPFYGTEHGVIATCIVSDAESSSEMSICLPEIELPKYKPYRIGDVALFARSGALSVDVESSEFRGWVYADGKEYRKSMFPSAYEAFKSLPGSGLDKFVVPVISGFLKPNPGAVFADGSRLSAVQWRNCVPYHSHADISQSQISEYNGQATAIATVPYSTKGSSSSKYIGESLHTQYTGDRDVLSGLSITLNTNRFSSKATDTGGSDVSLDVESYPRHAVVQAMVYIGMQGE